MNRFSKYFKNEQKITESILKAHLEREPLFCDTINTSIVRKNRSCVHNVFYKNVLIGKFANTIEK